MTLNPEPYKEVSVRTAKEIWSILHDLLSGQGDLVGVFMDPTSHIQTQFSFLFMNLFPESP